MSTHGAESFPAGEQPDTLPDLTFDPEVPLRVLGVIETDGVTEIIYDTNNLFSIFVSAARVSGRVQRANGESLNDLVARNYLSAFDELERRDPEFFKQALKAAEKDQLELINRDSARANPLGAFVYLNGGAVEPDREAGQISDEQIVGSRIYTRLKPIVPELYPGQRAEDLCL